MPNEPIVHTQPPVISNPFARHLAEHVNAGAVAIESERATAEAQGKLVIAKRFPRDQARAYANIIDACRRPGLAEEAIYSFPRGAQTVSGPSIRLAEMLAANWGNIDYGIRELSRKEGVSEMEAYCWDLETNTMSSQKFTVRHIRDKKGGGVALTDERDIYELTANMGGRRLRARILAIIPADLVAAAMAQCDRTLAGAADAPLTDRIRRMIEAFKTLGVPASLIEQRVGHALDAVTGEELADLLKIHNSLRDGHSALGDWFGARQEAEAGPGAEVQGETPAPESADDSAPAGRRPRGRPRSTAGIAAVAENSVPKDAEPAAAAEAPATAAQNAKAMKDREARMKAAAAKEAHAPADSAPAQHSTVTAGTLTDGQRIEVVCHVETMRGISMANKDADGKVVSSPSAHVLLKGEYIGPAYHFGGGINVGTKDAPVYEPNAEWKAAKAEDLPVKLVIVGKSSPVSRKVGDTTVREVKVVALIQSIKIEEAHPEDPEVVEE